MLLAEGSIEILEFLNKHKMGYFKQLRDLKNFRTERFFSASTVSNRLKELVEYGALEKTIATSQGRNVVAYQITPAGSEALKLTDRFEEELRKILK